ncbi:MAG: ATP-binding protein [Verrucomicrobiales bacterium]|nr:ATP-binding protein [Verrucomicrobiales bacterium]
MKRIALVFLIGILLPAALLAILAVRSVKDQEMIANSQRAIAYQAACDARASEINLFMDDVRIFYGQLVDEFVERERKGSLSRFHEEIRDGWSQAAVGACVLDDGRILSPQSGGEPQVNLFLDNHADFLTNRRVVEVYEAPALLQNRIQVVAQQEREESEEGEQESAVVMEMAQADAEAPAQQKLKPSSWKVEASQNKLQEYRFEKQQVIPRTRNAEMAREFSESSLTDFPEQARLGGSPGAPVNADEVADAALPPAPVSPVAQTAPIPENSDLESEMDSLAQPASEAGQQRPDPENRPLGRTVAPSQYADPSLWANAPVQQEVPEALNYSQLSVDAVRFNDIAEQEREGAVSRIIDGELHVLLWKRHEQKPGHVFWVELDMAQIQQDIEPLFSSPSTQMNSLAGTPEMSLALLNANGDLVTQTVEGFETDWSRPFVAAEVGQILPRWEVAAYLLNPNAVSQSAKTVGLLLVWLVGLSLVAVAVGSFLIFRSVNYEMRMAARKTDFVSNVSHELKTPLTSIRMFSDLLVQSERADVEKTKKYSEVISKESARLSRLIHRLLDFSRLERGEMPLDQVRVDLAQLVPETVERYRPHMLAEGIDLQVEAGGIAELPIEGDADAISQVLLNLLSNAEKYGAKGKEILVEMKDAETKAIVRVHDRGPGIPRGQQKRIFEKFYRVDESIDSGIEGSGIGLALSRQIMERLGGDLLYESRVGGGSTFSIQLPKAKS